MKKTFTFFCSFTAVLLIGVLMFVSPTLVAQTYTNNDGITIVNAGSTPYPSTIEVVDGPASIDFMTVTIYGFSHEYANDVDILLVGPNGESIILMSDAGGSSAPASQDVTFSDAASEFLNTSEIVTGTFLPTNIGFALETFAGYTGVVGNPGPDGAATFSSQFGAIDANGTWSLYVADDFDTDNGSITGWEITFSGTPGCIDPLACNFNPDAAADDGSCCYGICVQLNVSAGDFPDEIEWELQDPSGVTVAAGGAPYAGTICLPSADCAYQMVMSDNTCCGWEGAQYTFVNPDGSIAGTGALPDGIGPQVDIIALGLLVGCTDPAATNFNPEAGCDDGSCVSCAPGETAAKFSMSDSANDGWDAGIYTIFDATGVGIFSGSLNTAAVGDGTGNGFDQFCLPSGCYTVELTNFDFPEEAGWSISDAADNLVLNQNAPVAATGFAIGFAWGDATGCEFAGCTNADCFNFNPFATTDDGSCVCPPANDLCTNAEILECGDVVSGSLAFASEDASAITCQNESGTNVAVTTAGVWFKFVGTGATVTATTCSTGMWDSKMHVYSGECGSLSCVAANDDDATCTAIRSSTVVFDSEVGVEYFILISRYSATITGTDFLISISCSSNEVLGCTDVASECYNPLATTDDGSCCYVEPTFEASASEICAGETITFTITSATPVSFATFTFDNGQESFTFEGTTVEVPFANTGIYSVSLFVEGAVSNNQATYADFIVVNDLTTYYADADGDGFGDANATVSACSLPEGYTTNNEDCDDGNDTVYPNAEEVCNGIDDDCNTFIDNNAGVNWYADADGDGFGNSADAIFTCEAPLGYVLNDGDCDDADPTTNPEAIEDCDLVDNNCNDQIDESGSVVFYADADGDGFGDAANTTLSCTAPIGYTDNAEDCDDTNADVNPTADDVCDEIDNNCNDEIDENGNDIYYADADGDGYGDLSVTATGCSAPAGYVGNSEDCDDGNAEINPEAVETCDGVDNNCNVDVDDNAGLAYYVDADGDGYGSAEALAVISCVPVAGAVTNNTDCNDNSAAVRPGAIDLCNWIDDNCNDVVDEGCVAPAPNNDEIGGAVIVPVTAFNVTTPVYGNLYNATTSTEVISDLGASGNQDLWYQFTTPANAVRIRAYSAVNNVLVELQDEAGNLIDVENINAGNGTEIMNISGLVPNATYRIAVRNMSGFGGAFVINIRRYDASSLVTNTAQPLCGNARAAYVNANAYTFYFTSQTDGATYSRTITNSTITLLSNVANLPGNDIYNTTIDATFNVTNGLGGSEVISVAGIVSTPLQVTGNTPMTLRASDACPNQKPTSANILAQPFACGAVDFQWEFTRTAPSAALPVTFLKGNSSRYLRLNTVPGMQNGATYNVRVRPRYSNGSYGTWGPVQCVSTIGVAGLEEWNADVETPQTETDVEEMEVAPNFTIFPNPIQGGEVNLMSDVSLANSTVVISDISGRQIAAWNNVAINAGVHVFRPQTELTFGVYFLRIAAENGSVVKRFVVE